MSAAIRVLTVGRTKRGPLLAAEEHYLERARQRLSLEREHVPQSRARRAAERRAEEARAIAAARRPREALVTLEVEGRALGSPAFARALEGWRAGGGLLLVIGGPDGIDQGLSREADARLSLGPLTLPHELALVVLLEQLYRASLARENHPYGRH